MCKNLIVPYCLAIAIIVQVIWEKFSYVSETLNLDAIEIDQLV